MANPNHFTVFYILMVSVLCIGYATGQYETPNQLCGGWFKSANGSIRFNNTGPADDPDFTDKVNKVCVWTINPGLPSQNDAYTIRISRIPGLTCNSEDYVSISHFSLRSKEVTATETWRCGPDAIYPDIPGTVIVVVFRSQLLTNGTGFNLQWNESGQWMNRTGLRTTFYSWGKQSVDPLPYFATGFNRNEIATLAFPRGNDTGSGSTYVMQFTFDAIRFDNCAIADKPEECESSILIAEILGDGKLEIRKVYAQRGGEVTPDPTPIKGDGGLFILVWVADVWGAGGSFQMVYQTVRG